MKKNFKKINEDWKRKNGCSEFDFKKENMIIFDGGLFPVCEKKVMRQKIRTRNGKILTRKIKIDAMNGKYKGKFDG